MSADSVIGFAFESLPVRGALIHMDRSWRRMQRDHDYDALLTETLGHAAAATGLIAQSLKFDGAITLQLQGKGALQMLIMQCTSELHMRGMASVEADYTARTFVELAGKVSSGRLQFGSIRQVEIAHKPTATRTLAIAGGIDIKTEGGIVTVDPKGNVIKGQSTTVDSGALKA